jgi:predicted  nucleic acid-binding Zn-ribbon protein
MSQPFQLYRLQQTDSQLDQARARLAKIEKILSDNARLRQAQSQAEATDQALQAARKALRRAEEEVQAQNIKIEQTEAALYGGRVRNPKELQDLQKESASLKKYKLVLEDKQLDEMLAVEAAEEAHQQSTNELEKVKGEIISQNASLLGERTALQKDAERLESERRAIAAGIDGPDRTLYEQLRQQRRGVAVAKISDNACSACGSTLTPGLIQAARSPNQLSRCSFCGRILYAG